VFSLHLTFALLFKMYCPPIEIKTVNNAPMLIFVIVSKCFIVVVWIGLFRSKGRIPPDPIGGCDACRVRCHRLLPGRCRTLPQWGQCCATVLPPCDSHGRRRTVRRQSTWQHTPPSCRSLRQWHGGGLGDRS